MNTDKQWNAACDALLNQGYEAIDNVSIPSAYDSFDCPYHSIPEDTDYPICPACGEEASIFCVQFKHKETGEEKWLQRCEWCGQVVPESE